MKVPYDELVELPTTKQLIVIRHIEENTPHVFTGETKQEATKFISKYKAISEENAFKEC